VCPEFRVSQKQDKIQNEKKRKWITNWDSEWIQVKKNWVRVD
jgi:hypothetical protein